MKITNKFTLDYNWLVSLNKSNNEIFELDIEYYSLLLKSFEQKHLKKIKLNDFSGFLETVYHAMNINSFAVDGVLFNEYLFKIPTIKYKDHIRDVKRKKAESSVLHVMRIAQLIFMNLIQEYIKNILKVNKDNIIIFQNNQVHTLPSVNVLLHENNSSNYQIWRIDMNNKIPLLSEGNYVKSFKVKKIETVEKHIKSSIPDVDKNNMIGVEMIESADVTRVIIGVKDTLVLNRIFKGYNKFTPGLFLELQQYITRNNKFDYRFIKD